MWTFLSFISAPLPYVPRKYDSKDSFRSEYISAPIITLPPVCDTLDNTTTYTDAFSEQSYIKGIFLELNPNHWLNPASIHFYAFAEKNMQKGSIQRQGDVL